MDSEQKPVSTESRAPEEPSSVGLDANLAGLLTYVLGFVSGIIFLIIEKKSSYVRFHAMQSTLTFLGLFVIQIVAGFVPILGWIVVLLVPLVSVILWILLMVKAFQGERYQLPYVGEVAEERARLTS